MRFFGLFISNGFVATDYLKKKTLRQSMPGLAFLKPVFEQVN